MQASQSMSQELIYNALYASLELTDQILQIWLTMTFAVIVSTYVAGKRFDRPIYLLVSGLYALASAIQLVRFCSTGYQTFHFRHLLVARGFEPWPVPVAASIAIGLGYLILLIAGTIGTLWFVRTAWKRAEGDPGG